MAGVTRHSVIAETVPIRIVLLRPQPEQRVCHGVAQNAGRIVWRERGRHENRRPPAKIVSRLRL